MRPYTAANILAQALCIEEKKGRCPRVSPEIGKIRIKDFSDMSYTADDDKDFHIRTVRDETLIDSAGELDDSHEFALNMFDRGNASDLPDSDRSQNCRTDGINRQTCFDRDR